ncbi:MAG: hypothetical protein IPJ84_10990 [Bdellovibrionales bacterium]|nr:hypothetical protein [Bdellovibrionales bacterium]
MLKRVLALSVIISQSIAASAFAGPSNLKELVLEADKFFPKSSGIFSPEGVTLNGVQETIEPGSLGKCWIVVERSGDLVGMSDYDFVTGNGGGLTSKESLLAQLSADDRTIELNSNDSRFQFKTVATLSSDGTLKVKHVRYPYIVNGVIPGFISDASSSTCIVNLNDQN